MAIQKAKVNEKKSLPEVYAGKIIDRCVQDLKDNQGIEEILEIIREELIHDFICLRFPENIRLQALLKRRLDETLPKLDIPILQVREELPPWRYAIASTIGVFLGTITFGSLLRMAGLAESSRFFFSALVGASLMTWLFSLVSRSKTIQRSICAAVGVATIFEIWSMAALPSKLWNRLGDKGRGKRFLSYLLILLYVMISRPKLVEPDREESEAIAKKVLTVWLEYAEYIIDDYENLSSAEIAVSSKALPSGIVDKIYKLHGASKDELEVVAIEILQEAKNQGFQGMDGPPCFKGREPSRPLIWESEMVKLYDAYGVIEDGDSIVIEDPPIIVSGEILQKGLVRKTKKGAMKNGG